MLFISSVLKDIDEWISVPWEIEAFLARVILHLYVTYGDKIPSEKFPSRVILTLMAKRVSHGTTGLENMQMMLKVLLENAIFTVRMFLCTSNVYNLRKQFIMSNPDRESMYIVATKSAKQSPFLLGLII